MIAKSTLLAAFLVLTVATTHAADPNAADSKSEPGRPAVLCPVTDRPIEYDHYGYLRGKRVYFATADAKAKFEENPFAYADGARRQWEQNPPLRTQVKCPVTGRPIDRDVHVEGPDDRIYFADEDAKTEWSKWPADKQKARLGGCYIFQTKCPVSGNDIDPTVSREINGRTIYFFCKYCAADSKEEPEKVVKAYDAHVKANRKAWREKHGDAGGESGAAGEKG